jgi:hypothetical protein
MLSAYLLKVSVSVKIFESGNKSCEINNNETAKYCANIIQWKTQTDKSPKLQLTFI